MQTFKMKVSRKELVKGKNEFVEKGSVEVTVPTLADCAGFVQTAEVDKMDDEGLPYYKSEEANFIQGAIIAAVKVMVRNRIEVTDSGVQFKEGLKAPTTWAELVAESDRTNGEALAILRECKEDFAKWVATLKKSDAASKTLVQLFSVKAARQTQANDKKEKFKAYVEQFMEATPAEKLERYERTLTSIMADLEPVEDAEDF